VNAGDTFIPPKPYDHLYMVISDPAMDRDRVVLVNFTSYEPEEEDCCLANPSEHVFLTKKSCVRYKDARIATVDSLTKLVQTGQLRSHQPLSADLLARVRQGAALSDYLPEGCRKILADQHLV
jgi:hypothetical protein